MKKITASLMIALALAGWTSLSTPVLAGVDASDLSAAERDELEAQLDEARAQMDAAAAKLGELHSRLYAMETIGHPGQKPMLGVLIGERGSNGGLLLSGVTPGGGAEAAGMQAGDEITSVNDADLTDARSAMAVLQDAMTGVMPGETVAVGYQRDGSFTLASVTTQAKGVFIMGMTGAPAVHMDIQALEDMADSVAGQFTEVEINSQWVESLESLENLESLEELQMLGEIGPQLHRAIRMGGPGGGLRLESMDGDLADYFGVDSGVLVLSAPPAPEGEGPLLKAGDVLLSVDGEEIRNPGDGYRTLMGRPHALNDGESVLSVEVMRQGAREIVQVTPRQLGGGNHSISIHSSGPNEMDIRVIAPDSP